MGWITIQTISPKSFIGMLNLLACSSMNEPVPAAQILFSENGYIAVFETDIF
jgi:hypothetical protein